MINTINKQERGNPVSLLKKKEMPAGRARQTVIYEVIPDSSFEEFSQSFTNAQDIAVDAFVADGILKNIILLTDTKVGLVIDYQVAMRYDDSTNQFLSELLSGNETKIIKNGKSFLKTLHHSGFSMRGPIFDFSIAESVLKAGVRKTEGYNSLVKEYCGRNPISMVNYRYTLTERHVCEVAREIEVMFRLKERMEHKLSQFMLKEVAQLEFDCIYSVASIENTGVGFDSERYRTLLDNLRQHKEKLEQEHKWLCSGDTVQMDSVAVDSDFEEDFKRTEYLLQHYNEEFLGHVQRDGRIHSTYRQNDSDTGRIYCSNPNLQQFPRDKEFRKCIVSGSGNKFVIADYSQVQLRIAAEISGDKAMIKAFQEGQDIHRITAAVITDKAIEDISEEERRAAKAVNFGFLFGMAAKGLQDYAEKSYKTKMTIEEAAQFRERFFAKYEGLRNWQDRCIHNRYNKVSRTLNNRRRIWTESPRPTEILNASIQGTEADILKFALVKIHKELEHTDAKVVLIIHDEIIVESSAEKAEEVKDIVVRCMKEAGQVLLKQVPVEVDAVIGDSWAAK